MKVFIGSTRNCSITKDIIGKYLNELGYETKDISVNSNDPYELVVNGVREANSTNDFRLIFIDDFGIAPFMIASKFKSIIVAEIEDFHSAKMTRDHNNTNTITIGVKILGIDSIKSAIKKFLVSNYSGGRHQVRVNMLYKLLNREDI